MHIAGYVVLFIHLIKYGRQPQVWFFYLLLLMTFALNPHYCCLSLLLSSPSSPFDSFLSPSSLMALSLAPTVARTAILGEGAALFSRPFKARPVDSIRQEVFRQQSAGHASSPWFAPSVIPSETPRDLLPARQASAGPVPPAKRRRHRRRQPLPL